MLKSANIVTEPRSAAANEPAARPVRLLDRYVAVRRETEALCQPLETEDYVVSSMPEVSTTKWHLGHTCWFFEHLVLPRFVPEYTPLDARYTELFNADSVLTGQPHCRARRGLVTRPTVSEVYQYRAHVDQHMRTLLERVRDDQDHPAGALVELGLQHEEQHQELILTDIKHVFWMNPFRTAYRVRAPSLVVAAPPPLAWFGVPEGLYRVGHRGRGFAFDNELPAHRVFLDTYRLASRLTTNAEYLAFIDAGGYRRPELWLSDGWARMRSGGWEAPLYWERSGDGWTEFTLAGTRLLDLNAPVGHVSLYEADAFARWSGHRLPTEAEWEVAAGTAPVTGSFADSGRFHPAVALRSDEKVPKQLFGEIWQWTSSPYTAYPGHKPAAGVVGDYHRQWVSDQWVLRGASCLTPRSHARVTYRNFFPSEARWQFAGIRLAA